MAATGAGCAASDPELEGEGGDDTTTTTTTGQGGSGGGEGGEGGGTQNPCGTDCSAIQAPQCYVSVCNEGLHPGPVGSCVVVPDEDGASCDDGEFCTVDDTCQAGVCTGGPQNDCGMSPPECEEVICDEEANACTTQAVADGDPCTSDDLCHVGTQCEKGFCTGGAPKDCFFQPVPSDCHISACNPNTGICEPVVGNEGEPCVDQNDLCSVGNTCAGGVCGGGMPKDCSSLTIGCFDGVCDPMTGQCTQEPIAPGGQCAEATDDCNQGICDMNGNCNPTPANEAGACNVDNCVAGQTCSSGTCQGGSQVTACTDNDLCCPSGCTISTDNDCLTEITLAALNNGHNGNLGGIAGADAMCNQQAAVNGIGGTWKAFLSDANQDVVDIVPTYLQGFPVKNLNGLTLWNNWSEVFTATTWIGAGAKLYSFDGKLVNENTGANPEWTDADGWHGSTPSGLVDSANTCSNWTSTSGNGRGGEWDFGDFIVGSQSQEIHACSYTAAVACVRIGP